MLKPEISLRMDPVKPIFGESLAIYCNVTIDMQGMIRHDVTWILPNGTAHKSTDSYEEHELVIKALGSMDLGQYTCLATVTAIPYPHLQTVVHLKNTINVSISGKCREFCCYE